MLLGASPATKPELTWPFMPFDAQSGSPELLLGFMTTTSDVRFSVHLANQMEPTIFNL
jgi:hypothetical protein